MNQKKLFLEIFKKANKKYKKSKYRLAGDAWPNDWQTLIATIYSAQARDELTIPVMENLFQNLPTLKKFAKTPLSKIEFLTKKINYYKTKSKNSLATTKLLLLKFKGKVPKTIEELTSLPGVGRKTANLIISTVHNSPGICVDTHVHRISNLLGIVNTKTPYKTEIELKKISPKKYWSKINRLFVLWGKDVPGKDKNRLLNKLKEKT